MQHTTTLHVSGTDAPTVGSLISGIKKPIYVLTLAKGVDSHEIHVSDPAAAREYFAALEAAVHELVIAANQALAPTAVVS